MCSPAILPVLKFVGGIGASLLGAAMNRRSQNRAIEQQNALIMQSLNETNQRQNQINDVALQTARQFDTPVQQEATETRQQQIEQNIHQALLQANTAAPYAATSGRVSDDYLDEVARLTLKTGADATERAKWFAATQAPGFVAYENALRASRAGEQIGRTADYARNDNNLTLGYASNIQPRESIAGGLLSAGGQALAGRGLGDIFARFSLPRLPALPYISRGPAMYTR